jgi:hypothetical protein
MQREACHLSETNRALLFRRFSEALYTYLPEQKVIFLQAICVAFSEIFETKFLVIIETDFVL